MVTGGQKMHKWIEDIVQKCARKYKYLRTHLEYDDILQEGRLAALNCLDNNSHIKDTKILLKLVSVAVKWRIYILVNKNLSVVTRPKKERGAKRYEVPIAITQLNNEGETTDIIECIASDTKDPEYIYSKKEISERALRIAQNRDQKRTDYLLRSLTGETFESIANGSKSKQRIAQEIKWICSYTRGIL